MIIDRIENGIAICDDFTIPTSLLPKDAREGDILIKKGDVYVIDKEGTKKRLEELTTRMNKLFK